MKTLYWNDKNLKQITKLRFISTIGHRWWDVSYCKGIDYDDNEVIVSVPFSHIPKGKGNINKHILDYAKDDKVYVKGLNVFNVISCFQ
tara:strand:- start:4501 stop:4764 length:264 start_codon:yes stop_codon:yes gene_type:complete